MGNYYQTLYEMAKDLSADTVNKIRVAHQLRRDELITGKQLLSICEKYGEENRHYIAMCNACEKAWKGDRYGIHGEKSQTTKIFGRKTDYTLTDDEQALVAEAKEILATSV